MEEGADFLDQGDGLVLLVFELKEEELVPGPAIENGVGIRDGNEIGADVLQDQIPELMAQGIVDFLEAIEVEKAKISVSFVILEMFLQREVVIKAGQAVLVGAFDEIVEVVSDEVQFGEDEDANVLRLAVVHGHREVDGLPVVKDREDERTRLPVDGAGTEGVEQPFLIIFVATGLANRAFGVESQDEIARGPALPEAENGERIEQKIKRLVREIWAFLDLGHHKSTRFF